MKDFTTKSGFATISGLLDAKRLKEFKPRRLSKFEKKFLLDDVGLYNEIPFDKRPEWAAKTVTDDRCDLCNQPLRSGIVVCYRCGTCVFCGALQADRYDNACLDCGNNAPGRTDDTEITLNTNDI